MKIAFLIGVNDIGGAEFVSYHHVLMAFRNGAEIIVLSGTGGKFYELIKAAGVKIEIVTMNPAPDVVSRLLQSCDVVFNCNFFAITPLVIQLKQKIGFRYLTILHSDINWVYNQVVKFEKGTDGYYAIHKKIMDSFISYGVMDKRKFVVIPNCVDFDLISAESHYRMTVRSEFGFKDGDFVIGMITRVAADKNILDAVKILANLPASLKAQLLIIGGAATSAASENYCNRVKRLSQTIGGGKFAPRVKITGNLDMQDVYKTMQAFDIGLNCSPSEGLPIALLEMMSAGIACVMPSIGDIPDVLFGRGIVVPIKQRLEINEILSEPCYTLAEIGLFVKAIVDLHSHRPVMEQFGKSAAHYVRDYRSLKYQEKCLLKFLDMGTKRKAAVAKILPNECIGEGIPEMAEALRKKDQMMVATGIVGEEDVSKKDCFPEGSGQAALLPMTLPMVSVLMPIRDGNPMWIEAAIESIAAQQYAGKIELVVVNHDCRLGLTEKINQIMEARNERIHMLGVYATDETLQFSEVLDLGVRACKGDIIVRMDCDDIAEFDLVTKLADFMCAQPDIDVCGVQVKFFGAKSMITAHPLRITREIAFKFAGNWFINHPGVAIRKSALLKVGGYGKTKTGFAEDYHLWCKILLAGGVIANLPIMLMNYRCYNKEWRYPEGYADFLEKEKSTLKG